MIPFLIVLILVMTLISYGVVAFYASAFCRSKSWETRLGTWAVALTLGILCCFVRILALGMMYLLVLLQLSRLAVWLWKRFAKAPQGKGRPALLRWVYRTGLVPLLLVALVLVWGYGNMMTIRQTGYTITSEKLSRDYKVVFLSDVHFGTIQSPELLEELVEEINALKPNLVILGGDIVEDSTTLQQMELCFHILGGLESQYGTYFVYGNHDRQRYSSDPAYPEQQLAAAIRSNGIRILTDDYVSLNGELLLLGREDLSAGEDRRELDALKRHDNIPFLITVDHQPNDVIENVRLNTDLLLCGHTHGGQIFPLGWLSFLYGGHVYGQYQEGLTDIVVTSGVAGWGFPIRTQGVSEYVVVDLISAP